MQQNLSTLKIQPAIRLAQSNDLDSIFDLVKELAVYEKAPEKVTATIETYQDAFESGHFRAFVADLGGKIVGMALFYRTFSTWKGPMMYLEDFIVNEEYRRKGIGKLLFEAFVALAKEERSALCKWQVLRWNSPAINFYQKYDTVLDDEWVDVKMYF